MRNLILRNTLAEGCYWRLTETSEGLLIQATVGRYKGWRLGFLPDYIPETGSHPRTAWNLVLNEHANDGSPWKLTPAGDAHLLQATADPFKGWYVDVLLEAYVLDRTIREQDETSCNRQYPPIADQAPPAAIRGGPGDSAP